ncbi:ThiF family adenylyltransferase [Hydrocarboniphaga effusa]|uniref:ThiF family adenylyltransferase n=1 Tax=Hydrocarboniphaga effusa TaxID=243629 RepID=UPI003BAC0F92
MSRALISRSPDLQRLQAEGYEIEIRSNHLLVHSVPYVNSKRQVARGILVSHLTLAGETTTAPENHIAYFIGEHPCQVDGVPIPQIRLDQNPLPPLAAGIPVKHAFSNKPANGYPNFYEKMARYVEVISAPARALDHDATALTFKVIESVHEDSVFHYRDSATSKAGIGLISRRLAMSKIAIIGLGGTGGFVLDSAAKTWVKEIHLFDGDLFLQHNAFRAPGAASLEDLQIQPMKTDYFAAMYSKMRKGIHSHPVYVTSENTQSLAGFEFVFLCIDKASAKEPIIQFLIAHKIPFVDVGMDVASVPEEDSLVGTLRVTAVTPEKNDHVSSRISLTDAPEGAEYAQNIQISDLNALNALLAVIKWKKLCGFYQDVIKEHHMTYAINVNQLLSDDKK